jgi:hypothetical protein
MPGVSLMNELANGRPSVSTGAYQIDEIEAMGNLHDANEQFILSHPFFQIQGHGMSSVLDPSPKHGVWRRPVSISLPEETGKRFRLLRKNFGNFVKISSLLDFPNRDWDLKTFCLN